MSQRGRQDREHSRICSFKALGDRLFEGARRIRLSGCVLWAVTFQLR